MYVESSRAGARVVARASTSGRVETPPRRYDATGRRGKGCPGRAATQWCVHHRARREIRAFSSTTSSSAEDAVPESIDAFGRERLPWRASAKHAAAAAWDDEDEDEEADDASDDASDGVMTAVRLGNASAFVGWEVYLDDDPETLVGVVSDVAAMSSRGGEAEEEAREDDESEAGDGGGETNVRGAVMTTDDGDGLSEDERAFLSRLDDSLSVRTAYDDDDEAFDSDEAFLLLVEGLHETTLGERPLHYVPFVPSMFPRWIPTSQALFLDPPAGLLDLATREVQLNELRSDLLPFCKMLGADTYGMPQRLSMMNQGQKDLVKRVEALGDWREVAIELDLKPDAAPWYYWDNIDNVEDALLKLVDAFWFEETDGEETFWYNDISGALRLEPPTSGDGGGLDVPVMPTMAHLVEARRWDLHHAVVLHGGYRTVARELGWQRSRQIENRHLLSFEAFSEEILELIDDESLIDIGLRPRQLPCARQLEEIGRDDLIKFMKHHGGFSAVSKKLKLQPSRASRDAYPTVRVLAKALRAFALEHDITTPVTPRRMDKKVVLLPSAIDLMSNDRNDLRTAMEKFPSEDIAAAGNMKMRYTRMTYAEARAELQKWKFEEGSRSIFQNWCRAGNKPWNMPVNPQPYYKKQGTWVSWRDFMCGTE